MVKTKTEELLPLPFACEVKPVDRPTSQPDPALLFSARLDSTRCALLAPLGCPTSSLISRKGKVQPLLLLRAAHRTASSVVFAGILIVSSRLGASSQHRRLPCHSLSSFCWSRGARRHCVAKRRTRESFSSLSFVSSPALLTPRRSRSACRLVAAN